MDEFLGIQGEDVVGGAVDGLALDGSEDDSQDSSLEDVITNNNNNNNNNTREDSGLPEEIDIPTLGTSPVHTSNLVEEHQAQLLQVQGEVEEDNNQRMNEEGNQEGIENELEKILSQQRKYRAKSVIIEFMDECNELIRIAANYWRSLNQYFQLYYEFIKIGREEKKYILNRCIISRLIDFYLGNLSPYSIQEQQQQHLDINNNKGAESSMAVVVEVQASKIQLSERNKININYLLDFLLELLNDSEIHINYSPFEVEIFKYIENNDDLQISFEEELKECEIEIKLNSKKNGAMGGLPVDEGDAIQASSESSPKEEEEEREEEEEVKYEKIDIKLLYNPTFFIKQINENQNISSSKEIINKLVENNLYFSKVLIESLINEFYTISIQQMNQMNQNQSQHHSVMNNHQQQQQQQQQEQQYANYFEVFQLLLTKNDMIKKWRVNKILDLLIKIGRQSNQMTNFFIIRNLNDWSNKYEDVNNYLFSNLIQYIYQWIIDSNFDHVREASEELIHSFFYREQQQYNPSEVQHQAEAEGAHANTSAEGHRKGGENGSSGIGVNTGTSSSSSSAIIHDRGGDGFIEFVEECMDLGGPTKPEGTANTGSSGKSQVQGGMVSELVPVKNYQERKNQLFYYLIELLAHTRKHLTNETHKYQFKVGEDEYKSSPWKLVNYLKLLKFTLDSNDKVKSLLSNKFEEFLHLLNDMESCNFEQDMNRTAMYELLNHILDISEESAQFYFTGNEYYKHSLLQFRICYHLRYHEYNRSTVCLYFKFIRRLAFSSSDFSKSLTINDNFKWVVDNLCFNCQYPFQLTHEISSIVLHCLSRFSSFRDYVILTILGKNGNSNQFAGDIAVHLLNCALLSYENYFYLFKKKGYRVIIEYPLFFDDIQDQSSLLSIVNALEVLIKLSNWLLNHPSVPFHPPNTYNNLPSPSSSSSLQQQPVSGPFSPQSSPAGPTSSNSPGASTAIPNDKSNFIKKWRKHVNFSSTMFYYFESITEDRVLELNYRLALNLAKLDPSFLDSLVNFLKSEHHKYFCYQSSSDYDKLHYQQSKKPSFKIHLPEFKSDDHLAYFNFLYELSLFSLSHSTDQHLFDSTFSLCLFFSFFKFSFLLFLPIYFFLPLLLPLPLHDQTTSLFLFCSYSILDKVRLIWGEGINSDIHINRNDKQCESAR